MNQDGGRGRWGGRRVGAGRKPARKPFGKAPVNVLVTFPGGKVDPALVEPPDGLPEGLQAIWRAWAPSALERRTLSTDTVAAFRMLCELESRRQGILERLSQVTAGTNPGDERIYLQYSKQVEGLLGRFCLAPFGKPLASEKPQASVNPFEQFKQA